MAKRELSSSAFKEGHKKVGGRKKGTPNKTGAETKRNIEDIILGRMDKVEKALDDMYEEDKDKFLVHMHKFAEFVLPKRAAVNMTTTNTSDLKSELSELEYKD